MWAESERGAGGSGEGHLFMCGEISTPPEIMWPHINLAGQ